MSPADATRRSFLTGSASLLALHTLPASALRQGDQTHIDPAAPRGRDRNLLANAAPPETIAASLIPLEKYRPFPIIQDRAAWNGLHPETRAHLVSEGEPYLGWHWPEMPATLFLEYARIGNRTHYEDLRRDRIAALKALLFAECVENKGRFRDDIVNGLWAICEQSFWGVPAHLYIQKADLGLPDPRDPIVDLFAAELSALVATAVYLLNDTLDQVNPLVRERVIFETERRIIDPLLAQNFMWMGLPGGKTRHDLPWLVDPPAGEVQPVNNWDAWICWNWLTTVLFLDRNPARRTRGVQKIVVCLDKFLNTFPDDGGCEEGPGYWNVGVGNCFETLELLHSASAGKIDIYSDPLLLNMGLYVPRTQIQGNFYINQGDASSIVKLDPDKLYRFAKRVGSADLLDTALADRAVEYSPSAGAAELARFHVLGAVLPALFNEANLRREPPREAPLYRDTWLPDSHVMAARKHSGSSEGLYLACIADNNGKSHSHNDTGSFWVYSNGLPILIDLGQQTYTKQSFDKHRYEIPSTQSGLHNLPTIGTVHPGMPGTQSGPAAGQRTAGTGFDQGAGPQFGATDVRYASNDGAAQLSMNLAKAYPADAGLSSWLRALRLERATDIVSIEDAYSLTRSQAVTFNLMTTCTVRLVSEGVLELTKPVWGQTDKPTHAATCPPVSISFDGRRLACVIETITLENDELVRNWGAQVFRIRLSARPAVSGNYKFVIRSA